MTSRMARVAGREQGQAAVMLIGSVVGVALLLGGCADRSDAPQDVVDEWLRPTGAPSSSTPSDASGERTSPDGVYGQTARTSLLGQAPDEGSCDMEAVQ